MQDFNKIKLLPNNLDDINDIESVADEIYIKKFKHDDNIIKPDRNEEQTTASDPLLTKIDEHFNNEEIIDDNANQNIVTSDETENDFREIRSTSGYEQINDNVLLPPSTELQNVDSAHTESQRADTNDAESIFDDDYSSEEDYAVESDGIKVARKNSIRMHTSYQRTSARHPFLQQGFIASPGYPSYYVGDSNCSWFITAPKDQRIRLTVLDISLRCKFSLKDKLKIKNRK